MPHFPSIYRRTSRTKGDPGQPTMPSQPRTHATRVALTIDILKTATLARIEKSQLRATVQVERGAWRRPAG